MFAQIKYQITNEKKVNPSIITQLLTLFEKHKENARPDNK